MIGAPVTIPAISWLHLKPGTYGELWRSGANVLFSATAKGLMLAYREPRHRADLPQDIQDICSAFDEDPPQHGWIMLQVAGTVLPGLPTYEV